MVFIWSFYTINLIIKTIQKIILSRIKNKPKNLIKRSDHGGEIGLRLKRYVIVLLYRKLMYPKKPNMIIMLTKDDIDSGRRLLKELSKNCNRRKTSPVLNIPQISFVLLSSLVILRSYFIYLFWVVSHSQKHPPQVMMGRNEMLRLQYRHPSHNSSLRQGAYSQDRVLGFQFLD